MASPVTKVKLMLCALMITAGAFSFPTAPVHARRANLNVQLSIADGLLKHRTDGRVVVMFAPNGTNPLDDTDVTSSPNKIFGKNVFNVGQRDTITLSSGSNDSSATGVYGWPLVSLDEVPVGTYRVQGFLTKYDNVVRSDGSSLRLHFPCGDGAPNIDAFGSLITSAVDVEIRGDSQTIRLTFDSVEPVAKFQGKEPGGCAQGNYADTELLKHIKIRSKALSAFWGRDMYVGANVLLPYGYNASDKKKRYPVLYSQGHFPGGNGALRYSSSNFSDSWNKGIIPGKNGEPEREAPRMILVTFRHEAPFYDDSYAVNTANLGPYGDAINDELIPYIEKTFNTIPKPYARIQEGGSTGGWISAASLIFRPDLFGACFSSYPDSLDFHKHQDIPLYSGGNAYQRPDGSAIPSIREFKNDTEVVLATVAQENHWELSFGTSSRSFLQWDVWNAVFGVQGLNGYPLEPWDKVTGEIYPDAVEYWKSMDLANYIVSNWKNSRGLGKALKGRIFIYVGTHDDYYLNEGVQEFQKHTDAVGGAGWANVTILPGKPHGGNYQARDTWDYLELVYGWIQDHAPTGKTPLSSSATASSTRGNEFHEVIKRGGHQAALARQAPPLINYKMNAKAGDTVHASAGHWDPGVTLKAQWIVCSKPIADPFTVKQGESVKYKAAKSNKGCSLQLSVTGSKRNYATETRHSQSIVIEK